MAIITFQRPGDAAAAREKYDGKLIDGSKLFKLFSIRPVYIYFVPRTSNKDRNNC